MTEASPRIARALISVSDKTGVEPFAQALAARGVEILSTGGTARMLRAAGVAVRDVSDATGFPEIMDGRVKTLHPAVHGGLLARRDDPAHLAAMADQGIAGIDLLAVNLYPFEAARARGADFDACVENIDVGGPAMIRAAAKNHAFVTVVVEPEDYARVLDDMAAHDGATTGATRRALAARAFARTAAYDAAIAEWLAVEARETADAGEGGAKRRTVAGTLAQTLRYGENPHQKAALYLTGDARPGVATARLLQGKALSYNNIADADAAFELASEFADDPRAAVAIIKHANPCGVALGDSVADAYARAKACDPVSAFGGVIAVNRPLTADAARAITELFTEVVIAPDADDAARAVFAAKPNLRLLVAGAMADPAAPGDQLRSVAGGLLFQSRDDARIAAADLTIVTQRAPSDAEIADMLFAFRVAKHVKSNAIVYARDAATVGVGAGQMSRLDSARIAARKAEDAARAVGAETPATQGAVAASDAFFPFPDGLEAIIAAGATAVVQPGGAMRDKEVIAAADAAGLAMAFTGVRCFRH